MDIRDWVKTLIRQAEPADRVTKNGAFGLLGGGMPGGVEEELEFGVAAADSLGDPFFDEPFRGGAVAGRGERLQAGQ